MAYCWTRTVTHSLPRRPCTIRRHTRNRSKLAADCANKREREQRRLLPFLLDGGARLRPIPLHRETVTNSLPTPATRNPASPRSRAEHLLPGPEHIRSEERRVGKECRSRW